MGIKRGTTKGVIAVAAGVANQQAGMLPRAALDGPLGEYAAFVIGTFVGLVVADVLARDVTPGRPVLGAVKGLSGALGAAFTLVVLADVGPLSQVCGSQLGPQIEQATGGACEDYLRLVTGTFVGVVLGDVFLAPFTRASDS